MHDKKQRSGFAAGPFSNIVLAFIVGAIFALLISPTVSSIVEEKGVKITGFIDGINATKDSGIEQGEIITSIDGKEIRTINNITKALEQKNPGEKITLTTNVSSYEIILSQNPQDPSKPYLGTYLSTEVEVKDSVKEKYSFLPSLLLWLAGLFYWLYVLNLGIGLFNLVPIGPIDGGRILQVTLYKFIKNKEKANIIWKNIGFFFLSLVVISLAIGFLR
jgi:membrane-associated protease RseP (regulator of RpoE activity)